MAAVIVQSDKPGHPALHKRLCHALACADYVLVAHDVAHTTAHDVAHGIAHDVAFDIALNTACSTTHNILIAKSFMVT